MVRSVVMVDSFVVWLLFLVVVFGFYESIQNLVVGATKAATATLVEKRLSVLRKIRNLPSLLLAGSFMGGGESMATKCMYRNWGNDFIIHDSRFA